MIKETLLNIYCAFDSGTYYMEYQNSVYIYESGFIIDKIDNYTICKNIPTNIFSFKYDNKIHLSLEEIKESLVYPEPLYEALGRQLAIEEIIYNL